jgi:hypothetical protein
MRAGFVSSFFVLGLLTSATIQLHITVADLAKICFTLLLRRPLGSRLLEFLVTSTVDGLEHGLRTPNEGKNQRNLKIWADVAVKICFGRT